MLVLFQRVPGPDAVYWRGRIALAAVDALAWPALGVAGAISLPVRAGITGTLLISLLLICAIGRLHKAILKNQRYRFTTWVWGKAVGVLVVVGAGLKLVTGLVAS